MNSRSVGMRDGGHTGTQAHRHAHRHSAGTQRTLSGHSAGTQRVHSGHSAGPQALIHRHSAGTQRVHSGSTAGPQRVRSGSAAGTLSGSTGPQVPRSGCTATPRLKDKLKDGFPPEPSLDGRRLGGSAAQRLGGGGGGSHSSGGLGGGLDGSVAAAQRRHTWRQSAQTPRAFHRARHEARLPKLRGGHQGGGFCSDAPGLRSLGNSGGHLRGRELVP